MNTLYVSTRADWREWLAANYRTADDVWLVAYKKATGRPSLRYCDAVEEALCFGWIDSTRKGLDAERYAQRFSPRRPGSTYSQPNIERLRDLRRERRLMPEVLRSVNDTLDAPFQYPEDVVDALRANPAAWENFQRYSEPYRRIRIAYVDAARGRPEEFEKRLAHLIKMTERDRQFGYGIERYLN